MVVPLNLPLTSSPDLRINGGSINNAIYTLIGGVLTVKAKKTLNISGGDFHFTKINVEGTGGGATLNFTETVRIYVENSLTVGNASRIVFKSASRSELYIGNPGSISMENNSSIDTPASTTCFGIYVVGIGPVVIRNNSSSNFYAVIYAPLATVQLFNGVELSGDIVANKVFLEEGVIVHYNTALRSLPIPPGDPGGVGGTPRFISWTKPDWKIK